MESYSVTYADQTHERVQSYAEAVRKANHWPDTTLISVRYAVRIPDCGDPETKRLYTAKRSMN